MILITNMLVLCSHFLSCCFFLTAMEEGRLIVVDLNLDVLTYAPKELPLMHAVSNLVIPALVDQLYSLKKIILPHLLMEHPQVGYRFFLYQSISIFPELYILLCSYSCVHITSIHLECYIQ